MVAGTPDVLVTERRQRRSDRRTRLQVGDSCTEAESESIVDDEGRQVSDRRRQDRRRQIDPTTCERDYSGAEVEFMRAMDNYKRKSGRPFPTWSEVLEVLMALGYRKVAEPTAMEWRSSGD